METITIIILIVISIGLSIGWFACHHQSKKAQQGFIDRICEGDNVLAIYIEKEAGFLRAQNQHQFQASELSADYLDTHKKLKALTELNRITKGSATRYKNRDLKNKNIILAMTGQLQKLNIKFDGFKLIEDKNTPIFSLIHDIANKCDCVLSNEGIGGICTKCRKPLK